MNYIYIILGILLAVLLLFIAYTLYNDYKTTQKNNEFIENNEFQNKKQVNKDKLLFFYANWCNHSKKSKPVWEKIKKDETFKQFNIDYVDIDGEDKKKSHVLKIYNIKEYPTIVLDKNNKKYIFDANLEEETLLKFLTSVYDN